MFKECGGYTLRDAEDTVNLLKAIETPTTTYFVPTLEDVLNLYENGVTETKELPVDTVESIINNSSTDVNESLYSDVVKSFNKENKPFEQYNPKDYETITKKFGKDLGNILYEFVSEDKETISRMTDKGILLEYRNNGHFTSIDIKHCRIPKCQEIPSILKASKFFSPKYHDGKTIPLKFLKTCLENYKI